jgi:hypothetical protein
MRYISGGSEAQLDRYVIPIQFVTAERNSVSNAARNHTAAVRGHNIKKIGIIVVF